jgi:hypothetical protein
MEVSFVAAIGAPLLQCGDCDRSGISAVIGTRNTKMWLKIGKLK